MGSLLFVRAALARRGQATVEEGKTLLHFLTLQMTGLMGSLSPYYEADCDYIYSLSHVGWQYVGRAGATRRSPTLFGGPLYIAYVIMHVE